MKDFFNLATLLQTLFLGLSGAIACGWFGYWESYTENGKALPKSVERINNVLAIHIPRLPGLNIFAGIMIIINVVGYNLIGYYFA